MGPRRAGAGRPRPIRPRLAGGLLGLLLGSLALTAQAAPPDLDLAPEGVAPTPAQMVLWNPPPPTPDAQDPGALAGDPAALIRFVESQPDRLSVDKMDPALAVTLAQVLLRGNRTFLAEKLLHDATKKWPESIDLGRAWARVLISLGRPTPAFERLNELKPRASMDPVLRYLLARALLGIEPRTPERERAAIVELEAALEIDPNYTDPDGVTAADVREVIRRIQTGARRQGGP